MIVHLWNGERKIYGEVLNYDMSNFLAEMGGFVGLFLGFVHFEFAYFWPKGHEYLTVCKVKFCSQGLAPFEAVAHLRMARQGEVIPGVP